MHFNERLRSIRESKNLTFERFAALFGVSTRTQKNYEKGATKPDSDYLLQLHQSGEDILWLLTGKPSQNKLTAEELLLLEKFRTADKRKQQMVLGLLIMDDEKIQQSVVNIGGVGNQAAGGDINNGK